MEYPGSTKYMNTIVDWLKSLDMEVLTWEAGKTEIWFENQIRTTVKPWVLFTYEDTNAFAEVIQVIEMYGQVIVKPKNDYFSKESKLSYLLEFTTVHAMDCLAGEMEANE